MAARDQSSLNSAVQDSLEQLGAALLSADEHRLVVGYQELELRLGWVWLQDLLTSAPPAIWPETIAESVVQRAAEIRSDEADWLALRQRVWPVLISQAAGRAMLVRAPEVVAFPFAEALLICVGYPVEQGWRYVTMPQLAAWEVDGSALIAAAVANLRAQTPAGAVQTVEAHHYALDIGDGFDSSRLLILDELLTEAPEAGALAIVPSREVLSFAPFNSRGARNLRQLVNLAARCYTDWPYPIDTGLFYVHRSQAIHIPVTRDDDGTPRLHLPKELADVQAALVERGEW